MPATKPKSKPKPTPTETDPEKPKRFIPPFSWHRDQAPVIQMPGHTDGPERAYSADLIQDYQRVRQPYSFGGHLYTSHGHAFGRGVDYKTSYDMWELMPVEEYKSRGGVEYTVGQSAAFKDYGSEGEVVSWHNRKYAHTRPVVMVVPEREPDIWTVPKPDPGVSIVIAETDEDEQTEAAGRDTEYTDTWKRDMNSEVDAADYDAAMKEAEEEEEEGEDE